MFQLVDGEHGLAGGGVEGSGIPRPVRQHEPPFLPDALVIIFTTIDNTRNVFPDQVVVRFEACPVDVDLLTQRGLCKPRHNGNLGEKVGGDGLHLAPRRMDGADSVLH